MNTKLPKRSDLTRQALNEAFCLLYRVKPLEKITVRELTTKAGFDRSTFYQYFLNLDDLLQQLESQVIAELVKSHNAASYDQDATSFIQDLVQIYKGQAIYVNALFGQYGRYHFLEHFKQSLSLQQIQPDLVEDPKYSPYLLEYRLSGALDIFCLWLSRDQDLTVEELIALVAKLYHYD